MATYSWLSKTDAVSQLQGRLSNSQYWTATELWLLLTEALRAWNAFTEQWNLEWVLTNANGAWINSGTTAGSTRLRTVTSNDLFARMEYTLLEPPSGGTWTGTSQFALSDLQAALQKRTQEVIQASRCNIAQLAPINAVPLQRRYALADSTLEPHRIRFIGVLDPVKLVYLYRTMSREDTQGFQYFENAYLQTEGIPLAWSVASEPPLAFDVDLSPNIPGTFEVLALQAGPTFSPPAASLLGVPDDWSWLPMYGALSDVLSKEAEATDRQRAAYCLQRYEQGLQAMVKSNWLVNATVNGIAVDTPSLKEMDDFLPEWQTRTGSLPTVVQAGIDFFAPTPGTGQSVGVTLVGNSPLLDSTATYVQVSRDDWNPVLDYSQHIASLKLGDMDFQATAGLLQNFFRGAAGTNKRLMQLGLFVDVLRTQGQRETR